MLEGFALCWSFRNRFDVLRRSIFTADETCPKDIDFVLVDAASDDTTLNSLRGFVKTIKDRKIRICECARRTSLSEAWNLGMMLTDKRYVIFSSSDVVFKSDMWINRLRNGLITSMYVLLGNHAVFCLDKKIIGNVGWFDEGFGIGAHFDCDYMIRADEAHVVIKNMGNAGYYVHDEEDTPYTERVKDKDDNRLPIGNFENERYFKRKWLSEWPGWEHLKGTGVDLPHPPTNLKVCERAIPEVDPHPVQTRKICLALEN